MGQTHPAAHTGRNCNPNSDGPTWRHHAWRAMNTDVNLIHYGSNAAIGNFIQTLFRRNEKCLSRFLPDSALTRLNRCPQPDCRVEAELFNVLEAALWAFTATGGLYSPAIIDDLEHAGYDASFEQIRTEQETEEEQVDTTKHRSQCEQIRLDAATLTVHRPVGLRLDLGGIGKGWTVDRAADILHRDGPFLLNAGGDLYAAGNPGQPHGWEIDVEDPHDLAQSLACIAVTDCAVATSSIARRRWHKGRRAMHHIIDPRTGLPAQTDAVAVTVIARRTVIAEVYAKAALILGAKTGSRHLERRNLDGLIVAQDGTIHLTGRMDDRIIDATPGFVHRSVQTQRVFARSAANVNI